MIANQYFGISYHLDSHLLVKDFNKDNTCNNENPEEGDLSLEGGSSCLVTPIIPQKKKHHLASKMGSTHSSTSRVDDKQLRTRK